MRQFFIPTIAAASLLALPALAQTSNSTASNSSPPSAAEIQQDLHKDLSKAGYTDIQIIPGSFLVHAKDSKGHPTEMVVSPNSVTAITATGSSDSSNGSSTSKK